MRLTCPRSPPQHPNSGAPSVRPSACLAAGPGAFSLRAALPSAGPDALRSPGSAGQRSPGGPAGAAGQGRARRGRAGPAEPPLRGARRITAAAPAPKPGSREKPLEGLCDPVKFSERIKTSKGLGGASAHFVPRRGKLGPAAGRAGQGRAGPVGAGGAGWGGGPVSRGQRDAGCGRPYPAI